MDESKNKFLKFMDLCRTVTNNNVAVLNLLQQRYDNTNPHFLWSENFRQLIDKCSEKIDHDPSHKFVHIQSLVEDLKSYKAKPLKHLLRGEKPPKSPSDEPILKRAKLEEATAHRHNNFPKAQGCKLIPLSDLLDVQSSSTQIVSVGSPECCVVDIIGDPEEVEPVRSVPSLPSPCIESTNMTLTGKSAVAEQIGTENLGDSACTQENKTTDQSEDSTRTCSSSSQSRVSLSHVTRLEKLLQKLSERIQRLEERELSLDDMDREDSVYLLEEKYKKKFMQVWDKLCELTGGVKSTGREVEKMVRFQGTKYEEANRKISRYVNKSHTFPDYQDILQILTRCNRKYDYKLKKTAVESLARDAFSELGSILQARRIKDYVLNLGCSLTDKLRSEVDPAVGDLDLSEKLERSRREGLVKLEQVINTFAEKQATEGDATDDEEELLDEGTNAELNKSVNEADLLNELEQEQDAVLLSLSPSPDDNPVICIDDETCSQEEAAVDSLSSPLIGVAVRTNDELAKCQSAGSVTKKAPSSCDPDDVIRLRQMTGVNDDCGNNSQTSTDPVSPSVKVMPSHTSSDTNLTDEKMDELVIEIDDVDETSCSKSVASEIAENVLQTVTRSWTQHNRDTFKDVVSKALQEISGANGISSNDGNSISAGMRTLSPAVVSSTGLSSTDSSRFIGRILTVNSRLSPLDQQLEKPLASQSDSGGPSRLPRSPGSHLEHAESVICEKPRGSSPSRPPRPTRPSSSKVTSRATSNMRYGKRHVQDLYEISSQIVASVMQSNKKPLDDDVIICDDDASPVRKVVTSSRTSPAVNASSKCKALGSNAARLSSVLDDSQDVVLVDYVDAPSYVTNGRSSKPASVPISAVTCVSPSSYGTRYPQINSATYPQEQEQARARSRSSNEGESRSPAMEPRRLVTNISHSMDNSVIVLD